MWEAGSCGKDQLEIGYVNQILTKKKKLIKEKIETFFLHSQAFKEERLALIKIEEFSLIWSLSSETF